MEFGDNDIWLTEGNEFDIFTSSVKGMTTQITEPEESVTSTVGIDVTVHSRQVGTQYQNEDFQFPGLCAHFNPSIIRNSSGDWTTAMMQDQSSLGNVALLRNVMASPFLFSSIAPNEGRQGSHFEQQSFPDGFPIPILQNHSIRHTSQTSEQVRLDESKSKNDVESMGKGPIQLCFGQGNMNPDNVPYAGFSLQQQNRQQGEFIDFQSMNMNNNQLAPETPGKSKRLEGHHFTEIAHLADSRQIDGRKHEKNFVQNFKEHVEVSRCDAISQQSDCQSSGILQTQNIQREMGETPDATKMQVQKPRRKKHRPKVVVEGKLARKPRQPKPKPAETPDNPARKRGRRKKEESSMGSQPSGVEESSVKHSKTVRKSAKKHLDFDLEEFQLNDGNKESVPVSKCNTDPQDKNNVESRSDTNFPLDNLTQTSNPPFSITNLLGQVPHKYSDLQDQQGSNPPSLRKQILRENLKALARDRDKKESGNNLDSNRSSENQATYPPTPQIMKDQRSKRDRSHMKDNNEYNIGLEYQLNHVTFKKRRMENRQNTFASSTTPCTPSRGQNCLNELNATLSFADVQYHLRKLQDEKYVLSSDQTEQRTNQTPETPAKKIKFVFRADNTGYSQSPPGSNMPLVCYQTERSEILEASFQTTTPLKVPRRRTKKDSKTSFSQTGSGILLSTAMVPFVNVTYLTDLITLKLQHLNINGCSEVIAREGLQQENALVLYNSGGGAMVPFGGFFTPRKQRPRAKVDLDSETNRVWMLLMGKDTGNFGETDNDKEKWWQGEREVFRGRADSFIARMHLIQGDRRFSKWKGSVVDSVVGVFLTQNVSDHLSSSAFMAFAARYPNRSSDESTKACAAIVKICTDNEVISVEEGCDHVVNLENQVNHPQSFNNEGSTVSHDAQYAEEKNMNLFNYSECRKTSDYIIDNTLKLSGGMKFLEVEDMRIQECTVSSQDSVVSSQQSSESPCQVADQIGLSLVSNIREDVTNNIWSNLLPHGSYTELLRMMGTKYPNEMYSSQGGSLASKEYSASEVVFSADHAENRNLVLDEGPSMGKLNLEECYERHTPAGVSFVPLHSTPSHSNPESATSGVSLDKVKCPSEYNTTEFTGEVKSVFIDPSSSTIDRHFEPFPSSLDDSYCQSHLCNYNNISTEKDDCMVNEKSSISLSKHKEKFNVNSMEQEVRMNFSQGEEDNRKCEPCSSQTNFPSTLRFTENSSLEDKHKNTILETVASTMKEQQFQMGTVKEVSKTRAKTEKKQTEIFDWDSLRREACRDNVKKDRTADKMDAVDWEAIRHAPASEVAETIKYRGMSNVLAARIKDFLDRLVRDHGSIDLEWLRDVPPDKVKDYLLSIRGLGLKSVECVRLLTLEHLAFPVDTNVGRICVRLGWVPLQPLPESLQLHLLDMYPMLETIQKYLWPRLCTLDQRTLYELHYQLITFGKVFCTKTKPNCNSCPMRGECKHFASAFASARLALPGPEEKNLVTSDIPTRSDHGSEPVIIEKSPLQLEGNPESHGSSVKNCEPIVEEPATPEPEPVADVLECDIEDTFYEDPDEIPTIKLNIEQFTQNLQDILQETNELQDGDISKALVALTPEAASIPQPKLKNVSRLRTEHLVYELPDTHPLLAGMDQREPDDPCPYLLAMWTPGETAQSTECPETSCNSQCTGRMCDSNTCFSCNSIREAQAQKVRGTLLIPCRTAMRGSFPLNGTYFQVNEVFADHSSSINPIDVPRDWIWNLPRRTVYFGTSVTSIFRGLTTGGIQHCFWRGFVCVRGFDQKSRYPRPLLARLHFTANRDMKNKRTGIKNEE